MLRHRRHHRARVQRYGVLLLVPVAAGLAIGCDSGDEPRAAPPSSAHSPSSSVVPTTAAPSTSPTTQAPPAGGGTTGRALDVTGKSVAGATIEVRLNDQRELITAQADAQGEYSLAVTGLREGENTMLVTARPPGEPGGEAGLAARFTIAKGGSTTSSAVTCAGVIDVVLNLDDAPDLRVVC